MTVEQAILIRMPMSDGEVASLVADLRATRARALKDLPGDRLDIVRYERMSTELEDLAQAAWLGGREAIAVAVRDLQGHAFIDTESMGDRSGIPDALADWIASGDIAVELRLPMSPGTAEPGPLARQPAPPPAIRWAAPPGIDGTRATTLRFKQQLDLAANGQPDAVISPHGVPNGVLTETLREFTHGHAPGFSAAVVYRDGSRGPSYQLRSLQLRATVANQAWTELRFALLSIRHVEMDIEVDGAWFRNTDISRPRPAGETDELAYQISCRQLETLCHPGRSVLIYMYQTGLQPAVMGFYRAVLVQMIKQPGSLAVIPMFFRSRPPSSNGRQVAGYVQQSYFAEGTPWTN